ncbi:MAG: hypothetical protein ACJAY8_000080 [Sphingobacteriales bacterium]|jgi:hypothetical protein
MDVNYGIMNWEKLKSAWEIFYKKVAIPCWVFICERKKEILSGNKAGLILMTIGIWCTTICTYSYFQDQFVRLNTVTNTSIKLSSVENYVLFEQHHHSTLDSTIIDVIRLKANIHESHRERYLSLLEMLYKNNYALLTLIPFFTGLTALLALSILGVGWKSAPGLLKTLFINCAFISGLASIYTEVYQQTENIQNFTQKFIAHSQIQKDLYNFALTGIGLNGDAVPFQIFISEINALERQLIDLHFGLKKRELTGEIFDLKK